MSPRRHFPRSDASPCPDSADCRRTYHAIIGGPESGDCCECCGQVVRDTDSQEVTWRRVTATVTGGPTVYWNGTTPSGWRLTVTRADSTTPGHGWGFSAYRPWPHNNAGEKVHASDGVGSVAQARKAAEMWLAALLAKTVSRDD